MKHVQTIISEELRQRLVIKMCETNQHKTVKEILRLALALYLKDVQLTESLFPAVTSKPSTERAVKPA